MADAGNGEENETIDNTMNGEVKDVEDADITCTPLLKAKSLLYPMTTMAAAGSLMAEGLVLRPKQENSNHLV